MMVCSRLRRVTDLFHKGQRLADILVPHAAVGRQIDYLARRRFRIMHQSQFARAVARV